MIVWPIPESKEIAVTIFKDPRTSEYEDKDWNITIEDVSFYQIALYEGKDAQFHINVQLCLSSIRFQLVNHVL